MGSSLPQKCTSSQVVGDPIPLSPLPLAKGKGEEFVRELNALLNTCLFVSYCAYATKTRSFRLDCHCEGRQPRGNLGIGGLETPAARVTMVRHGPYSLGQTPRNDKLVVLPLDIV